MSGKKQAFHFLSIPFSPYRFIITNSLVTVRRVSAIITFLFVVIVYQYVKYLLFLYCKYTPYFSRVNSFIVNRY